ncbi:YbbR-like domain-containing protein [Chryseomicrobium palamuruense]|uniref:YbbR-like domain-containing protein n=1 Tax=Chryseomicrobium palamuruense TaxID=682973 RepID=A0ABV8UU05_9BACL
MDKMMDNPWFLRIISLLFAVLLFITVQNELEGNQINTVGTSVESIPNVPVEVYYDDDNLIVTGAPETVTLYIEGPSNIVLSAQTMQDFTAFIDLSNLPLGEHEVEIQFENLSNRLDIRTDPQTVTVNIEELITEEFTVEPDMNERLLADNYVVKSTNVEPNRVTVTGARSIVEAISFVKATVSGEQGINESFEQQASVRVLDRDLNKLDVIIEPQEVTVSVEIEQYNKEIPVRLEQQGTPADDVTIDGVSTSVTNIRVYGARSAIDALEELEVPVDVSEIRESGTVQVPIELPEGISRANRDTIPVRIVVTVETPEPTPDEEASDAGINVEEEEAEDVSTTRTFEDVPIVVAGLTEEWSSTFTIPSEGVVSVTATGRESEINNLTAADVQVEVNASEVAEEGEYTLPLSVTGKTGIIWTAELTQATIVVATA